MARAKAAAPPAEAKGPPAAATGDGTTITTEVAARLIMVGPERVRQLAKQGWIKREGRDRFRVVDVVQGYINFLRDEQRRASKTESASRLQITRSREVELRTAREDHKLIETDEAIAVVDEVVGGLKTEMAGIPARATRDQRLRQIIETEINDVFRRAADRFEQRASDLRQSGEAPAPNTEDDAG